MNTQKTIDLMVALKLPGMAAAYQTMCEEPEHKLPTIHAAIAQLLDAENLAREHKRSKTFLKLSKVRYQVKMEEIICSAERNLSEETLAMLGEGSYIRKGQNVLITGATGTGKSFLASALVDHACLQGHKAICHPMLKFVETIQTSKQAGSYMKLIDHIKKHQLLVLDDWGLEPMEHSAKVALLQILEDRWGRGAVIITSQLPVKSWYEYINEPTIADAIMDRLTAKSHKIELKGPSLRNISN
jgi:DNA replication protein DnaC